MSNSIGASINFYREPNMLPSFFEHASRFFDDIVAVSAPPSAAPPDEESIAICRKWGVRVEHTTIDEGFGVVRTKCLHSCPTEWVMIMDADERFFPWLPVYDIHGEGRYANEGDPTPNLSVGIGEPCFNQGDLLRSMVRDAVNVDAIRFVRRHWMNFHMTIPCQNWNQEPDWQLRFMRNRPYLGYKTETRMHEHVVNFNTGGEPSYVSAGPRYGPFVDHFHVPAKAMEKDQRAEDKAIYDAIHFGTTAEAWEKLYGK